MLLLLHQCCYCFNKNPHRSSSSSSLSTTSSSLITTSSNHHYYYYYEYSIGLIFLLLSSVCWIVASVLVQYLYNNNNNGGGEESKEQDDDKFNSPFLVTYIGTSLFVVLLPIEYYCYYYYYYDATYYYNNNWNEKMLSTTSSSSSSSPPSSSSYDEMNNPNVDLLDDKNIEVYSNNNNEHEDDDDINKVNARPIKATNITLQQSESTTTTNDTTTTTITIIIKNYYLRVSLKIAPIYFVANYCFNASLLYTSSITSTIVLSSCTGPLFAFILALTFKEESFSKTKLVGVIFGILGSLLMAIHDSYYYNNIDNNDVTDVNIMTEVIPTIIESSNTTSIGRQLDATLTTTTTTFPTTLQYHVFADILALLSALGYGYYTVLLRMIVLSSTRMNHHQNQQNETQQQRQRQQLHSDNNNASSHLNMKLLLGSAGLWNFILGSPIAIYQIFVLVVNSNNSKNYNDETIITGNTSSIAASSTTTTSSSSSSSSSSSIWFVLGCLLIKGLIDNVLGDFFYAKAVVLTSATVASVGGGLQIPIAILCDLFIMDRQNVLDVSSIGSCLTILIGFVLVNLGQQQQEVELLDNKETASSNNKDGVDRQSVHQKDLEGQKNENDRIRRRQKRLIISS